MTQRLTFIGLGAMGQRMAARLLEAGHDLCVTNRSPGREVALLERGATSAPTPRAAAEGRAAVFSMVRDDAAARAVWLHPETGALAAMAAGALAIECSTLTPECVREIAEAAKERGIHFIDAPVAGSRPQAEAGALHFLVGGDPDAVAKARPLLEPMAGGVHHLGPTGSGALFKLIVNALFGVQIAALGELLAFGEAGGLESAATLEALGALPITSPAVRGVGARLVSGAHDPLFPIDLVAKDFDCVTAAAEAVGAEVPTSAAVGAVYRRAVESGRGELDIAGIGTLFGKPALARVARTASAGAVG